MLTVSFLKGQAAKCRRLARNVDAETANRLRRLADEFDDDARLTGGTRGRVVVSDPIFVGDLRIGEVNSWGVLACVSSERGFMAVVKRWLILKEDQMEIADGVTAPVATRHAAETAVKDVIATAFAAPNVGLVGRKYQCGLRAVGGVLHFVRDREIYGEGSDAVLFFKVVSGVVRTCKFLSDGRRQIDAFHVPGDVFGLEIGAEYSLSAAAVCDCTIISYLRRGVEKLGANSEELSLQLFSYVMRSLARAQEHSLSLGRRSAVEKVAAFLIEWAGYWPDSKVVTLAMTRADIADYLGLTIETVSRTLSKLESDALIELSSTRQLRLKNPAGLRHLSC